MKEGNARKVIIFDLDDTLYHEKKYVISGFRAVADFLHKKKEIDFYTTYALLLESFMREGRGKNFDHLIEVLHLTDIEPTELVEVYQGHTPDIALAGSAREVLKNLSKRYTLSLLTNGWPSVQKQKVTALGINQYFDSVHYAQEQGIEKRKPHGHYFLKILTQYGILPKEALMVGDEEATDGHGARAVGIDFCHIVRPGELASIEEYIRHE